MRPEKLSTLGAWRPQLGRQREGYTRSRDFSPLSPQCGRQAAPKRSRVASFEHWEPVPPTTSIPSVQSKGKPSVEAVILICDRGDGRPATESVRFTLGSRNMQLDLCSQHLQELAKGAHPVRRGRQRSASPKAAGTASAGNSSKGAGSTAKATGSKKSGGARRGRPPGSKNKPKN